MRPISDYDVYIFDCDGVILDSNKLKIDAMKKALVSLNIPKIKVTRCCEFFKNNFGKSRFHHVSYFVENILNDESAKIAMLEKQIIDKYGVACRELYINAPLTSKFLEFINRINGKFYIASGSFQEELIDVFKQRNLSFLFTDILGSPRPKNTIVKDIVAKESGKKCVMIGDAVSDFEASNLNEIDFIAYIPYSNVPDKLVQLSGEHGFRCINNWSEL